jgi:hypothetical protein
MVYVRLMADPERTYSEWIEGSYPDGVVYDDFYQAYGVFFDIFPFDKDHSIGRYVTNEQEWQALMSLREKMKIVYENVGARAPSQEYIDDEGWDAVVAAAREVLSISQE